MNYRLTEVDQTVRHLLERVERLDPGLAAELWDAIWAQVMQAAALVDSGGGAELHRPT